MEEERITAKLAKEICAFSNTFGGYVFLGVGDSHSIEGCSPWDEQRIHTVVHDSISPTPNIEVKTFQIDGKRKMFLLSSKKSWIFALIYSILIKSCVYL